MEDPAEPQLLPLGFGEPRAATAKSAQVRGRQRKDGGRWGVAAPAGRHLQSGRQKGSKRSARAQDEARQGPIELGGTQVLLSAEGGVGWPCALKKAPFPPALCKRTLSGLRPAVASGAALLSSYRRHLSRSHCWKPFPSSHRLCGSL